MFAALFAPKPLLDSDSADWISQQFDWILDQFGSDYFQQRTPLVLPNNDFFPGRADSHQAMAQCLLDSIQQYAGLSHWPTLLLDGSLEAPSSPTELPTLSPERGDQLAPLATPALPIYFNPAQVNDPQALISSLVQSISHALAQQVATPPHVEPSQWPLLVELVGVYLGFGVPLVNSAFVFAGGCGSCGKRAAQRQAYLSQDEALFALALFCQHKEITAEQVKPHLKPHLKKLYRQAEAQARNLRGYERGAH